MAAAPLANSLIDLGWILGGPDIKTSAGKQDIAVIYGRYYGLGGPTSLQQATYVASFMLFLQHLYCPSLSQYVHDPIPRLAAGVLYKEILKKHGQWHSS